MEQVGQGGLGGWSERSMSGKEESLDGAGRPLRPQQGHGFIPVGWKLLEGFNESGVML